VAVIFRLWLCDNLNKVKLINILLAANLLLLLFLGGRLVFKFPIWSPIDEGSHFNYIQFIAENRKLPILQQDYASWQVLAIAEGIYPQMTTLNPSAIGLGGYLYEAFQPPLYYAASVPAFLLGGSNFIHKVLGIRAQDLIILLATLIFCWKFAARVFKDKRKRAAFRIVSCFFFLMPGLVLRNVTVSNAILEFALSAVLFYLLLVKENLWWAAVTLGLLFLSRFTGIFLYGIFGLALAAKFLKELSAQKSSKIVLFPKFMILAAIPLFMLVPWFQFNRAHFGTTTANELSKEMQKSLVNPDDKDYGLKDLIPMTDTLMDTFFLPEEWGIHEGVPITWATIFFKVLVFFVVLPTSIILVAISAAKERGKALGKMIAATWEKNKPLIVSTAWILLNILMLYVIIVGENWPTRIGRYLYPSVVPLIYLTTEAGDFLLTERGKRILLLLAEAFALMVWAGIAVYC